MYNVFATSYTKEGILVLAYGFEIPYFPSPEELCDFASILISDAHELVITVHDVSDNSLIYGCLYGGDADA